MRYVLKNALVHTLKVDDKPFKGHVSIADGKIVGISTDASDLSGVTIDCEGLVLWPGLIDSHCHIGLFGKAMGERGVDGNESSKPCTPELRAIDAINPFDEAFDQACREGVTTVATGPGSGNAIAGQFVTMKTYGADFKSRIIREPSAMKMAFGENPKTNRPGQEPVTRMAIASIIRSMLSRAKQYAAEKEFAKKEGKPWPTVDLGLEALLPVLNRTLQVKAHAHRADDILTALRIAEEFDLDMSIEHGSEAHLIPQQLGAARGVIIGPLLGFPHKLEQKNQTAAAAKILEDHGVKIAIMSDLPATHPSAIILAAGACIREGLSEESALKALTIHAAEILDVADRVGSIEEGKDADLVLFKGNPLESVRAKCVLTMVDGEIAWRADQVSVSN